MNIPSDRDPFAEQQMSSETDARRARREAIRAGEGSWALMPLVLGALFFGALGLLFFAGDGLRRPIGQQA